MAVAKKAAKKSPGTALAKWDEKFAQHIKSGLDKMKGIGFGGLAIKFGRGKIEVGDSAFKDGKVEVVIIGFNAMNAWYESAYDATAITPPTCYALGDDHENLIPHEKVPAKDRQADCCNNCDKNVLGSAPVGKGKACGNRERLAVLLASDCSDGPSAGTAEMATGSLSPTNVSAFKEYLDNIAAQEKRPVWAVVTEITSEDDAKTQIKVSFKLVETIDDDDVLLALEKRLEKANEVLFMPYTPVQEAPAGKAGAAKKKAAPAGATKRFAKK